MQKIIEKLKTFYDFDMESRDDRIAIKRKTSESDWLNLAHDGRINIFTFGVELTKEEKKELNKINYNPALLSSAKEKYPNFIFIQGKQLMIALKGITEEKYCELFWGFDMRTEKYLKAIEKNIGYIDSSNNWNEPDWDEGYIEYDGYVNSSCFEIGKVKNGLWCGSYCVQIAIDDYVIVKHYFNKKPNPKDIMTYDTINDIKYKFKWSSDIKPVFDCWECGCTAHWLDFDGDLRAKYDALIEKYCGC